MGHLNVQEKEIKPTEDLFLLAVITIDTHLEKFSFSSTSDVSLDSSSVPGHNLTQSCYFKPFIIQIILTDLNSSFMFKINE